MKKLYYLPIIGLTTLLCIVLNTVTSAQRIGPGWPKRNELNLNLVYPFNMVNHDAFVFKRRIDALSSQKNNRIFALRGSIGYGKNKTYRDEITPIITGAVDNYFQRTLDTLRNEVFQTGLGVEFQFFGKRDRIRLHTGLELFYRGEFFENGNQFISISGNGIASTSISSSTISSSKLFGNRLFVGFSLFLNRHWSLGIESYGAVGFGRFSYFSSGSFGPGFGSSYMEGWSDADFVSMLSLNYHF